MTWKRASGRCHSGLVTAEPEPLSCLLGEPPARTLKYGNQDGGPGQLQPCLARLRFAQQCLNPCAGCSMIDLLAARIFVGRPGATFQQKPDDPGLSWRASSEPLPPRPVGWTARCNGVEPDLFRCLGFAPLSNNARTAANDRLGPTISPVGYHEFGHRTRKCGSCHVECRVAGV